MHLPLSLSIASLAYFALAENDGFGRTPVMGFNTYNAASCTINSTWVNQTMLAFSSLGFQKLGYEYFQLDCGWQGSQRQSNGSITYDSSAFPTGIKPLSAQAIDLGFKWSMYTDEGVYACAPSNPPPGSLGHETQDALQFAGWNVAYMKVDNCYVTANEDAPKTPMTDFPSRYGNMSNALRAVGIEGMLVCQWGVPYQNPAGTLEGPSDWTPPLSTSFRVSDDIAAGWSNVFRIMNEAISVNLAGHSGPGNFADMDLLEVGNPGMTTTQQASHFAIWAMFKSALMVSTNIVGISSTTQSILQNQGLIAVNQDSLGVPVTLVQRYTNNYDIFAGPLEGGDVAVLLVDQSGQSRSLTVDFEQVNVASATATNLWTGQVTNGATSMTTSVQAYGSMALRLSQVQTYTPPAPALTYIDATSGTIAGGANVQSCSGCANGQKVGYLGSGGTLTFNNVQTSATTQNVRIDYINCDVSYTNDGENVRGASISVNGGAGVPVLFPLTGYNWSANVTHNFLVELSGFQTGGYENTIEISGLSGSTQYAPDMSRIAVLS